MIEGFRVWVPGQLCVVLARPLGLRKGLSGEHLAPFQSMPAVALRDGSAR